jgi:hypothetical protein
MIFQILTRKNGTYLTIPALHPDTSGPFSTTWVDPFSSTSVSRTITQSYHLFFEDDLLGGDLNTTMTRGLLGDGSRMLHSIHLLSLLEWQNLYYKSCL